MNPISNQRSVTVVMLLPLVYPEQLSRAGLMHYETSVEELRQIYQHNYIESDFSVAGEKKNEF